MCMQFDVIHVASIFEWMSELNVDLKGDTCQMLRIHKSMKIFLLKNSVQWGFENKFWRKDFP